MTVLALDPGSIRTGYAYYRDADRLHEAGYLKGNTVEDKEPWDRILTMCHELRLLTELHRPDIIAIEVTSGHVNRGRHKGGGAGLPTYGMAVGGLYVYACVLAEDQTFDVWPIKENVWTKGVPKAKRQESVRLAEPKYRNMIAKDSDGDVADAIGIAWWAYGEGLLRRNEAVSVSAC